jgi:hypothetical protein
MKNNHQVSLKEKEPMCPACLTTFALLAVGATSTGGVAAFVVKKLRSNTRVNNAVPTTQTEKSFKMVTS